MTQSVSTIPSVGVTAFSAAGDTHFAPKPKLKEFLDSLSESDAKLVYGYLSEQLTAPLTRLELLLKNDEREALLERLRAEAKAKTETSSQSSIEDAEEEEEEEQEES